jgi:hypothetical protein
LATTLMLKDLFRCIVDAFVSQTQESRPMSYRQEKSISVDRVIGSVAIAAIFAALSGSSLVFVIVAGVLLANSFVNNKPRPPHICRR